MNNYDILKSVCRKIYIVGSGNFWYEGDIVGNDRTIYYKIYYHTLYSVYAIMTLLEIMAAVFGDFPVDEKRQSITLAVSHAIVMTKIIVVVYKKNFIKSLNQSMVRTCEAHEGSVFMTEKYNTIKMNFGAYCISVYSAVGCFLFEGFRKLFRGSHFITVVTLYPKFEDDSVMASSMRIFWTCALCCFMNNMVLSVDGLTVIHLVMLKYKFIVLRQYFDTLKEDFTSLNKTDKRLAAEKFSNGLIEGIVMHKELLRLTEDIDNSFGLVIAVQLLLSSGTAVSLLLEIALSDHLTFLVILKMSFVVGALFILLGLFLCNAGEITYQASLIKDSLFYCGWHDCIILPPPHRNVRKLVLLAITQAQRAVVMKAFKMIELSYGTFLQVVRVTYSVFALFYAQNK